MTPTTDHERNCRMACEELIRAAHLARAGEFIKATEVIDLAYEYMFPDPFDNPDGFLAKVDK